MGVVQDYTTFVITDNIPPNDRLAVLAASIGISGILRTENVSASKDFGTGNFVDLPLGILFDGKVTAQANFSSIVVFALSDGAVIDLTGASPETVLYFNKGGATGKIFLQVFGGGGNTFDGVNSSLGTDVFSKLTRSGTTTIDKIYSDSGRITLVNTLAVTHAGTQASRYLYGVSSFQTGGAGAMSGEVANLELLDVGLSTNPLKSAIFGERGVLAA